MRFKLMQIFVLSVLSMNAMAFEGKGFKIISEKITHSPGFNGGFVEVAAKKNFAPGYVNAKAWAYDAEGRVREIVKIQGDHNTYISNYTRQVQRYTYTYTLSCENAYEQFDRTVELQPQGNFTDSSHSYGVVQKTSEGTFRINVSTKIGDAESAWHEAHALLRIRN